MGEGLEAGDLGRLVLVDNPGHHPRGDFALCGGRVLNEGEPRQTFAGISVLHPAGLHHAGLWMDIGTPKRLEAVRRLAGD